MTAKELAEQAKANKPHVRYAYNAKGTAVAAWVENRWVAVAGIGIDGVWYSLQFELLVNGKPMHPADTVWIEVNARCSSCGREQSAENPLDDFQGNLYCTQPHGHGLYACIQFAELEYINDQDANPTEDAHSGSAACPDQHGRE